MYPQAMFGSLPVPTDRVQQENFIPSAPNLPMSFNFNSLPQMQQLNQLVAGYLIKVVQDNAGRNPLRCFTANMLSQNRWVNPEFESAFLAVSDYAFTILSSGQPNPEQAVVQAATQVASCLAAIYAQKFPMLVQNIPPQQQQELAGLLQTYQQIAQRIAQMRQQMQGGGQVGWGQQPQQQVGWGQQPPQFQQPRGQWAAGTVQQQNSGWGNQAPQNSGWGQQPQQNGWNQQSQQPSWQQNQPQQHNTAEAIVNRDNDRNSFTPAVTVKPQEQVSQVEVTKLSGVDAIMEEWGQETTQRHGGGYVVPTPQGSYQPQQQVQLQPTQTEPKRMTVIEKLSSPGEFMPLDLSKLQFINKMGFITENPNRLWDQLVLETGEEVRPAHSSGWKLTYDPSQPYGSYYDPERFAKFHIRKINEDGSMVVREKLLEIEDDVRPTMQYLNHEIRKNLGYRLPDDVKVAEVPWASLTREPLPVNKLAEHNEEQSKLEEGQEPTPVEILLLELNKAFHSFEEAELNYHKEMICNDVPEDMPVEYTFRKVTPLFLSKPHLAKLAELRQCECLVELAVVLRDAEMDLLLKAKLNAMLTQAVNDAVAYNLGCGKGLSIDDFINDMRELANTLVEDGYHNLCQTLNKERYAAIALPVLEVLTGEEQSAYLNQLIDGTPKEQRKQYQSVLSLVENNVVVHLTGVFGPGFQSDEALQVTKEMDEGSLAAIRSSFGRHHGDNKKRVKHHYFVDEVGTVLEVHRGWLVPGSMLVRRVKEI